jgi:rubrerythrin
VSQRPCDAGTETAEGLVTVIEKDAMIRLFSYYRDAEMRGAALLMKMMNRVEDPEAVVLFTRHIDDETRHAWMWTKRIRDEGAWPVRVLGKKLGVPTRLIGLFALTVIVEERSHKRYTDHAASPLCDERTRRILETITRDEKWHINWMEEWLMKLVQQAPAGGADPREILARYRDAEEEVFEEMKEEERGWLGFSLSDPPLLEQTQIA